MFKSKKNALAMVLVLSLLLVGCASKPKTPEEIVLTSFNQLNNSKSVAMDMVMKVGVDMTIAGQEPENMSFDITGKMGLVTKPMRMKGDMAMNMTMQGATMTIPAVFYFDTTETGGVFYVQYDNQWAKMTFDDPEFKDTLNAPVASNAKALPETLKVEMVGEEALGEQNCYKINITDTDTAWLEPLSSMGYTIDSQSMPPLVYTVWIDTKTNDLIKISMDLSSATNAALQQELESQGLLEGNEMKMTVLLDMTCSQFNKVEAIEIPEEAKSATEIQL